MGRLQILRFCFNSLLFLWLTESCCCARLQPWDVERTDCGVERYVEIGDEYEFESFPPRPFPQAQRRPEYAYSHNSYGDGSGRPEECTWLFKAVDDCELELETNRFSRGKVDCLEEYLLIGDEYSETRICGFSRPRPYSYSSGRELFLTHFSRAGHGRPETISKVNGAVRCIRRPRTPPTLCNETSTTPPPPEPKVCGELRINNCSTSGCCTLKSVFGGVHSPLSDGTADISISTKLDAGKVCTLQSYACTFGILPNETVVPLASPVRGFTTVCEQAILTTAFSPAQYGANFNFSGHIIDYSTLCFTSDPIQVCAMQVGFCLSTGPGVINTPD